MDILKEVRSSTRPWHDKMEEVALSDKIAAGTLSLSEYKAIILGHYIFHKEAEQRLLQHKELAATEGLELTSRMKTPFLARDVEQLGLKPYRFDFFPELTIDTLPQALGCMYVMEGATLGGTVIGRSLEKVPEITSTHAMQYYGCYGEQTGKRWKRFKEVVEQQVTEENDERNFLDTAANTFRQYAACMEKAMRQMRVTKD